MPTTRRAFIGSAGAVALTAAGTAAAGSSAAAPTTSLALRRAKFAGLVGTKFTLSGQGRSGAAVLEKVSDVVGAPAGSQTSFSLVFKPVGPALPQATYSLAHPRYASAPLFLVPINSSADVRYQAVINNHRQS